MSEDNENQEPEHIKDLRAKAERGSQAEAELAAAKRELAFSKAGINTDSKPAQALLKTYEGELTTDAIKAEAAEWGLAQGSSTPKADDEGEPDVKKYDSDSPEARHQALVDAEAQGDPAPTPPPPTKTGAELAFEGYAKARKEGRPRVDAEVEAFAAMISAGAQGDPTARWDKNEWMQKAAAAGHGGNVAR
jgi:hypothetical protein